jgi:hypothetical protein
VVRLVRAGIEKVTEAASGGSDNETAIAMEEVYVACQRVLDNTRVQLAPLPRRAPTNVPGDAQCGSVLAESCGRLFPVARSCDLILVAGG